MTSKAFELARLGNAYSDGALSHRNLIINGAMQVAVRGTSVSVSDGTNEGYQTLDRWRFNFGNNAGGACTVSQDTDVPSGYGFSNSYKVDVTTADTSIASTHHILFGQRIEAQDLRNSGWNYTSSSSYLTLSFWIKSNKTGVYCVSANLPDVGGTFRFVKEVTINSASTWEYKTVKIFGDSSAVINNDNGLGMDLEFNLVTATDRDNATDNSWHTADGSRCTSNQVNFFDSTSNNLWITGVQLEVGDTDTPFEHRSYSDQLQACQRFFHRIGGSTGSGLYDAVGAGVVVTGTTGYVNVPLKVQMRAKPSVTFTGTLIMHTGVTAPNLDNSNFSNYLDKNGGLLAPIRNGGSALTTGNGLILYCQNSADSADFDAEL